MLEVVLALQADHPAQVREVVLVHPAVDRRVQDRHHQAVDHQDVQDKIDIKRFLL